MVSSSKTLTVEGLEILDEKAMVFSSESSIEKDKEEEEEEDLCIEGSLLEILGFAESYETEDIVNMGKS